MSNGRPYGRSNPVMQIQLRFRSFMMFVGGPLVILAGILRGLGLL